MFRSSILRFSGGVWIFRDCESRIRSTKDWIKFPSLVGYYKDPGSAERLLFWNPCVLTWELFFSRYPTIKEYFSRYPTIKNISPTSPNIFCPNKQGFTNSFNPLGWFGRALGSLSHNAPSSQVGWTVKDLDLIEANEAFAAQALAVNKVPVVRSDDDSVAKVKLFSPRNYSPEKDPEIYVPKIFGNPTLTPPPKKKELAPPTIRVGQGFFFGRKLTPYSWGDSFGGCS